MGVLASAAPVTPKHPLLGSQFCASCAYESSQADELSVPAGARVHVLKTSDRGWWLCRCVGMGLWLGPRLAQTRHALTKPCLLRRFRGRAGLLPAVLLRPDGLGALLSGPGLHCGADSGEDGAGEARSSPEPFQTMTIPPTVPARPPLSAIQSRCCTITRRALGQDRRDQGHP